MVLYVLSAILGVYALQATLFGIRQEWLESSAVPPYRSLILLAAAWIFLNELSGLPGRKLRPSPRLGAALVILALTLQIGSGVIHLALLHSCANLLLAAGTLCWLVGYQALKQVRFAFLLACLAVPLSSDALLRFIFELRLFSTAVSAAVLSVFYSDVVREGTNIAVGASTIRVVEACSGFKTLSVTIVFSALLAYQQNTRTRKWRIVLVAPLLALAANVARIMTIAILLSTGHEALAEGQAHEWIGIFFFVVGMLTLSFLGSKVEHGLSHRFRAASRGARNLFGALRPGPVLILIAVVAVARGMEWRYTDPDWLSERPMSFSNGFDHAPRGWSVQAIELTKSELEAIGLPHALIRDYFRRGSTVGAPVELYILHSSHAEKVGHTPDICMRGDGYELDLRHDAWLETGTTRVPAEYLEFRKPDAIMLSYFWLRVGGSDFRNLLSRKVFTSIGQALSPLPGASMIRLSISTEPLNTKAARLELDRFVHEILPGLLPLIP